MRTIAALAFANGEYTCVAICVHNLDASIIPVASILTFISPFTLLPEISQTYTHKHSTLLHFPTSKRSDLLLLRLPSCNMRKRNAFICAGTIAARLLTGGNGFLGQHLVKLLQERRNGSNGDDETMVKEIRCVDLVPFEQRLGKFVYLESGDVRFRCTRFNKLCDAFQAILCRTIIFELINLFHHSFDFEIGYIVLHFKLLYLSSLETSLDCLNHFNHSTW